MDDGSPDRSGKICDDYAAKHPDKIRVIHQPNGGAGAARNHGISVSTGEYILFLDGDDYLSAALLSDLNKTTEKTAGQNRGAKAIRSSISPTVAAGVS